MTTGGSKRSCSRRIGPTLLGKLVQSIGKPPCDLGVTPPLLNRVAENETGKSWRQIRDPLSPTAVDLHATATGEVWQVRPLTDEQNPLFRAVQVTPPPHYLRTSGRPEGRVATMVLPGLRFTAIQTTTRMFVTQPVTEPPRLFGLCTTTSAQSPVWGQCDAPSQGGRYRAMNPIPTKVAWAPGWFAAFQMGPAVRVSVAPFLD